MWLRCALVLLPAVVVVAAAGLANAQSDGPAGAKEDIYLLRSIREPRPADPTRCTPQRIGFDPFPTDAERSFSFWTMQARAEDGKVTDGQARRVAELLGCFGPTAERTRQNFHAEIRFGSLVVQGRGACLALGIGVPEEGLFPVRCQLVLGKAGPYVGGLLTTNTLTSRQSFGGATDPPGYTQASIATIRLWKAQP